MGGPPGSRCLSGPRSDSEWMPSPPLLPISLPCALASPHLLGPRHSSRNSASTVAARMAGHAEEEAMLHPRAGRMHWAGRGREDRRESCGRQGGCGLCPFGEGPDRGRVPAGSSLSRGSESSSLARMLRMQAPPKTWQDAAKWARTPGKDGKWIVDSCPGPPLPSQVPLSPSSLSPQPGRWLLRWPRTLHCWLKKRPLEFP